MYRADGNRVYYNSEYICTISPPHRDIDETRFDGESWLDMRKRTKVLRYDVERRAEEMAKKVAEGLNAAYV